ncbi:MULTISPECIES: lipid IV(A) 3-deoxy-D-manno-octulosonic acid transferase [Glaesserella]|uniref:3-deoxy-D-manno-octulosonic acid transferase n=1 Tax=Glaesserella australis TaxID=2094024 RepID=A0A328BW00_9PAST|nr:MULTISPECIES: lipid IV(A) 3-deoxy-D-manno-octulosonic acid transferase [Glaesserella]AUI65226.1 3-deoxy-D-manno-octulosonic acid transferase [Glaesserella sp. 15-184]RAL18498.1 3-deoxy-D-manno-octulosonic acid transferase [Glaesserella australis]
MLRLIYTFLGYLIQPLVLFFMWKKGGKSPDYRKRLNERYGFYSGEIKPQKQGIVVHAASVGEVIAATPLIKAIQEKYPSLAITVTTVTPTGSARVDAAFGDSVHHLYLPYDLPDAIKRFLDFVEPKLVIVIETELWPNLIRQIHQRNIPFVIANARLSPRSAKRYGWIKSYLQTMFSEIDLILAQDKVSADRYIYLGFNANHLVNTGNLKFDLEITDLQRAKVKEAEQQLQLTTRPVWIAGSTHEGEEKMLLEAHQQLVKTYPDLVLILVPRHPERFDDVENLLQKMQVSYVTRSSGVPLQRTTSVLLGDTMGEMMLLYGLAQVAFVGGSLVKHGGHNPLEPIAFELPVISGVHTFNFPEIFAKLREVKGVIEIKSDVSAIVEAVNYFFEHPELGKSISQAGFEVLKENQGALSRHLELLSPYLEK